MNTRTDFNKQIGYLPMLCLMVMILLLVSACGGGGGGGDDDEDDTPDPTVTQYTLDVSVVGDGSVTLNPPGGIYDENTVVTLTAAPDDTPDGWDYAFSAWSGDLSGTSSTATLTMDADEHVTATFNLVNGLLIKENDYWGGDYRNTNWLVASIRDASGAYITDVTVEDVQLTEYVISKADGAVKAEAAIDMPAFEAVGDEELGFVKSATGGQALDLVFLLDKSASLVNYYAGLRLQITSLINEMVENHVDFRMAFRFYDEGPGRNRFLLSGRDQSPGR